jgi:DNA-binding MarR family transcriptional regulator
MNNLYLRFILVARVLSKKIKAIEGLDATALLLLNEIAIKCDQGKSLTVTEAMTLKTIASPATIHKNIDKLIKAQLIEIEYEEENHRSKFLTLTKNAKDYFEKMSKAIDTAVKS